MDAAGTIADALASLETRSADVRKAALLWVARVQTVVAPARAESTLEAGLALNHGFADDPHLGFEQLSWVSTAAVAPWRLKEIPLGRGMFHGLADSVAHVMSQHTHADYLRTYLLEAPLELVSLSGIDFLLRKAADEEERRLLLRRAIQHWRAEEHDWPLVNQYPRHSPQIRHRFFPLFRQWWTILPRNEAFKLAKEIVHRILESPDSGVNGQIGDALFTSTTALEIFQIFDVLLALDPERTHELVAKHLELGKALQRYPKGLESMEEEAESAKMPPRGPNQRGCFIIGSDMNYGRALLEADDTGDFNKLLEYAWNSYREDALSDDPNHAPKAFWPSTSKFRTIFYKMGKRSRETMDENLDSVPDSELRLFAQIEHAAGLCGLPELGSVAMRQPSRRSGRG